MRAQKKGPGSTAVLNGTRRDAVVEQPQPSKTSQSAVKLLPFHPLADMFPLLEGEPFKQLVEDIRKNGLRQDIDVSDGKIIDGRNRYRACIEAGIEPRIHQLRVKDDAGLAAFIISANIHRRHLTVAERDRLLVELLKKNPTMSTLQAAKAVGVSHTHGGKVRDAAQKKGDVATVATSVDTKGRKQPTTKPKSKSGSNATEIAASCVSEVESIVRAAIAKIKDMEVYVGLAGQLSNILKAIFSDVDGSCIDQPPTPDPGQESADRWLNVPDQQTRQPDQTNPSPHDQDGRARMYRRRDARRTGQGAGADRRL
jgi:ParB-like chromosome segregation protein Spo0J